MHNVKCSPEGAPLLKKSSPLQRRLSEEKKKKKKNRRFPFYLTLVAPVQEEPTLIHPVGDEVDAAAGGAAAGFLPEIDAHVGSVNNSGLRSHFVAYLTQAASRR